MNKYFYVLLATTCANAQLEVPEGEKNIADCLTAANIFTRYLDETQDKSLSESNSLLQDQIDACSDIVNVVPGDLTQEIIDDLLTTSPTSLNMAY